ncbi:hypothetical protein EOY42_23000 [Salmonella enterica]|nr:hypothetical protein [Salmonella enterica]
MLNFFHFVFRQAGQSHNCTEVYTIGQHISGHFLLTFFETLFFTYINAFIDADLLKLLCDGHKFTLHDLLKSPAEAGPDSSVSE